CEGIPLQFEVEEALDARTIYDRPIRVTAQGQCEVVHIDARTRKASRIARETVTCGNTCGAVPVALLELRSIFGNDQLIRRHLFCRTANRELETIGQERLKHESGLLPEDSVG